MKQYLKLIRINQWIKNIFIFLPIFFAGDLLDFNKLILSLYGFFCFSFVASSIYIINDYLDIENDRNHPEKKNRPLASGKVSKKEAIIIFIFIILITLSLLFFINNIKVNILILAYFMLNIAYSFRLKHIAIIDIVIIALGFLLRLFVGGYITGIELSDWAIILTFSLALIMAIGKRRGELVNDQINGKTRKALNGYNIDFLNNLLAISSTIMIISYLMYVLNAETQKRINHYVLYTVILVILAIFRYLQQTFVFNKTESPTKMIFKDRFLQVILLIWGICFIILIYFKDGFKH